jgi:hypothetical protein
MRERDANDDDSSAEKTTRREAARVNGSRHDEQKLQLAFPFIQQRGALHGTSVTVGSRELSALFRMSPQNTKQYITSAAVWLLT